MQLLLSLILSCYCAASPGEIIMKIPPGINLRETEVGANVPRATTSGRYDRIEVIIYYFSEGIEKFSYSDNDTMRESLTKGEIKALIKLKKSNILRKALFISVSGTNREQILRNFSRVLADTLASH